MSGGRRLAAMAGGAALLAALLAGAPASGAAQPAAHGTVDTITFWSQSLGTHKRALVWLPPSYQAQRSWRYPSVYYLHGMWGSETDWIRQGHLDTTLDSLTANGLPEFIVVMPDGDDAWYTTWNRLPDQAACRATFAPRDGDSSAETYCVPWPHYDDYIVHDLVSVIDARYRTIPQRAQRAIAGLSMGGYGAISLALRYPELFRAAASHSGVVSPVYTGARPFDGSPRYATSVEELRAKWGDRMWPLMAAAFGSDTAAWFAREPARMAQRLVADKARNIPAIFLDCGTEDGLIDQSRSLRAELVRLGLAPAYAEWPGKHDWAYWRLHARESLTWIGRQLSER